MGMDWQQHRDAAAGAAVMRETYTTIGVHLWLSGGVLRACLFSGKLVVRSMPLVDDNQEAERVLCLKAATLEKGPWHSLL